jgi:hypothetical protein
MGFLLPLLCAGLFGGTAPDVPFGILYQPAFCTDDMLRLPAEPYLPQAGDLFLATDYRPILQFGHRLAGAKDLHRSGIVIQLPDGQMALAEAGPFEEVHVCISDLLPQLCAYTAKEKVWIRRRCVPLTPEQSQRLTDFALRQCGKRFAKWRMLSQCWPLRSRGQLRTFVIGKPHGDRCSYFCSEFVAEAGVAAGIFDPCRTRPSATYPCDLFYAKSCNLFLRLRFDPELNAGWCPPARWLECPGAENKCEVE